MRNYSKINLLNNLINAGLQCLVMTRFSAFILGVTLVYVLINLQNYLIICEVLEKHLCLFSQKHEYISCDVFLENCRLEMTVCY